MLFNSHTNLRVQLAPGIPCALFSRGRDDLQTPDAKTAPRECDDVSSNSVVIPGRASWGEPGIHTHDSGYGFRARRFAASRNDEGN
jgi:hypothetical protein